MTATLIELGKRKDPAEIEHLKPPVDPATLTHKQLLERPETDAVADDPLSAWAAEQVGQLAELGPDPLLWPTAPDVRLPRAATPDGLASAGRPTSAP